MPWQCRLIEFTRGTSRRTLQIGDMFYGCTEQTMLDDEALPDDQQVGWDWIYWNCEPRKLSDYYKQHNSHRLPLLVWLPGNALFCVDSACWGPVHVDGRTETRYYGGWTVTGEAPFITVSPSINITGTYHGWLKDGIISDDCEGRTFKG